MLASRIFISATTGKPFKAPELSADAAQNYRALMGRAQSAVRNYDGSRYKRIELLTSIREIRQFAEEQASGGESLDDVIDAFAKQANPNDNSVFSLEGLYQKARQRLRGPADQESGFGMILKMMPLYDGKLKKDKNFPVIGSKPIEAQQARYQPKFAALIDELCENQIGLEDLSVTTGPYTLPHHLRDSYIILSVKKERLQIAVCDRADAPTYFSRDLNDPEFWKSEDTQLVRSGSLEALCDALRAKLPKDALVRRKPSDPGPWASPLPRLPKPEGDGDKDKPLVKRASRTSAIAADTAPAVELTSLWTATSAGAKPGVFMYAAPRKSRPDPGQRLDKIAADIIGYALKNHSWPSVDSDSPPEYPRNLWGAHEQWLINNQKSSIYKSVLNLVRGLAEIHKQRNGELPTRLSGPVPEAPGLSWELVDDCFIAKRRRTESLDIILRMDQPGHEERVQAEKTRRGTIREPAVAIKPRADRERRPRLSETFMRTSDYSDASAQDFSISLTKNAIIKEILRYASKNDRFPSLHNEQDKTDVRELWTRYDSWLIQYENTSLSSLIKSWTRGIGAEYASLHDGQLPDETSGPLPGYPAYDFALLNRCYLAYPKKPTLRQILGQQITANLALAEPVPGMS